MKANRATHKGSSSSRIPLEPRQKCSAILIPTARDIFPRVSRVALPIEREKTRTHATSTKASTFQKKTHGHDGNAGSPLVRG